MTAAYRDAEALQGPLDGLWRVRDGAGRLLFVLALSDPGEPPAPLASDPGHPHVEGAWRDPARSRAPDGSGLVSSVRRRADGSLEIRMASPDGQSETLAMRAARDGRWHGSLTVAGARRAVVMSRF